MKTAIKKMKSSLKLTIALDISANPEGNYKLKDKALTLIWHAIETVDLDPCYKPSAILKLSAMNSLEIANDYLKKIETDEQQLKTLNDHLQTTIWDIEAAE